MTSIRGIYSFSHLTFHEYFTARELETQDDLHQTLMNHLTEKRWREVILLTVGMLKNADSLLRRMKSQIDRMLAADEKLQQFLTWVQQKSTSINASYKPAAIRAFYFNLALDRDLDRVLDRAHDLDRNRALALDRDPALQKSLEELKEQLPNPQNDWDEFMQWWQTNSSAWTEQLRVVMIAHRNIGHNWQFSNIQKQQLQQYYNANQLLVDCLNSDSYISRQVRTEIEERLLLPVVPIDFVPPGSDSP